MIPILFAPSATSFTTNGIGRLSDATSCKVIEELNGQYELEMQYPMGGKYFSNISYSSIIVSKPFQNGTLQAFRIYKISKPMKGLITIYARHITYQLNFIPCAPFSGQSPARVLSNINTAVAEYCPFTFTTDISATSSWMLAEPRVVRNFLLGQDDSIQATYGGEYEWDNYTVKLLKNRGSNKGVKIRYGKNLIDLTQEENIETTITGVYPIWKNDSTLVELPEKVLHSSNASNFPFLRTEIHDFSSDIDNQPSVADLRRAAQIYIQQENIGIPEVNLTVNFVNLSETQEYADILDLQTVNLGDTVTVEFPELGVSATQKVTKTEYDVLSERYSKVTIGTVKRDLSTTLEDQLRSIGLKADSDAVDKSIAETKSTLENELAQKFQELNTNIDKATGLLNEGKRGHVVIARNSEGYANEIYFLDNENIALAKKVLRINMNGIGFSSTGYKGPYYQAWTIDGTMSLGGVNNSYGKLLIRDSSGTVIGEWNNNGINVGSGIIAGAKITGSEFISKNGEFYVQEDGEGVEVGWSGWSLFDNCMQSNAMGWSSNDHENPATGNSAAAAMNGGGDGTIVDGRDGYAGFQKLYLDDGWYEGSDGSFWDVTRTLKWLSARISTIESECWQHSESGGDDEGGGYDGDSGFDSEDGPIECDIQ